MTAVKIAKFLFLKYKRYLQVLKKFAIGLAGFCQLVLTLNFTEIFLRFLRSHPPRLALLPNKRLEPTGNPLPLPHRLYFNTLHYSLSISLLKKQPYPTILKFSFPSISPILSYTALLISTGCLTISFFKATPLSFVP